MFTYCPSARGLPELSTTPKFACPLHKAFRSLRGPASGAHSVAHLGEGGGVGTRPWWLALLACGGAYWPLAFEPSAMTSRHPYYCGHPPAWVGIQNATSAHGVLP